MSKGAKWLWLSVVTLLATIVGLYYYYNFKSTELEVAGFITGVVAVYLVVREDLLNWPIGLLNVIIFIPFFFQTKFYADMSLQIFYAVMQIHGWWSWKKGGQNHEPLKIRRLELTQWPWVIAAIGVGLAIYWPIIHHFKGTSPFWDSLLTVICIIAQIMLNRKILDNWILWIIADICYIPLFLSRNLVPTAILYAIFLGLAVSGYVAWRKTYRAAQPA